VRRSKAQDNIRVILLSNKILIDQAQTLAPHVRMRRIMSLVGALVSMAVGASGVFGQETFDDIPRNYTEWASVTPLFSRDYGEGRPLETNRSISGLAMARDREGNLYFGAGASFSKHSATGDLIWSRTHQNVTQVESPTGEPQTRYYESWDGQTPDLIPQGSSLEAREQVSPQAHEAVVDAAGSAYVSFRDLLNPTRSLVVKFDSDGNVLWRHVTEFASSTAAGTTAQGRVLKMLLLPDQSGAAVLEVAQGSARSNFETRLVVFEGTTSRSDRNGEWRNKLVYGRPAGAGSVGHHAIGVGMAFGEDGALYFATHDGRAGTPRPSDGTTIFPDPSSLVLRKLVSPFTGEDSPKAVASSRKAERWNDFAIGADGHIYLAGALTVSKKVVEQLAASFHGDSLLPRWRTSVLKDRKTARPSVANRLFVDNKGVTLVGTTSCFPNPFQLESLSVARLTLEGSVKWKRYQTASTFGTAFTDPEGNLYLIGTAYNNSTGSFSLWKYSVAGRLQFILDGLHYKTSRSRSVAHNPAVSVGLATPEGKLLIAVQEEAAYNPADRLLQVAVLSVPNTPVIDGKPGDNSPPAVVLRNPYVGPGKNHQGEHSINVTPGVVDDVELNIVAGRSSNDNEPRGVWYGIIGRDQKVGNTPHYIRSLNNSLYIEFMAKSADGKMSAASVLTAQRIGNTGAFKIQLKNPPLPPGDFRASGVQGKVALSWTDRSNDETAFVVQRRAKRKNGSFQTTATTIANLPANTVTFIDPAALPGNTYYYTVQASGPSGTSAPAMLEFSTR
jgi:hypothetical protein